MAKIKILIIDDDEDVRTMYTEIFRREGFMVYEANDGVSGLDRATKETPDVIITGIIMPRMDGFALKDALAKNVNTANVPVMMISHMGREEDKEKAEKMGVKDFIVQGMVSPNQVVEKVRTLFSAGDYKIKFNISELDAPKLANDFHLGEKFQCKNCLTEMELKLKPTDIKNHEFSAKFVCPNCG
jgi:PleD family two-component response regulator